MRFKRHSWTVSTIMESCLFFSVIDFSSFVQIAWAKMDLKRLMSGRVRLVVAELQYKHVLLYSCYFFKL